MPTGAYLYALAQSWGLYETPGERLAAAWDTVLSWLLQPLGAGIAGLIVGVIIGAVGARWGILRRQQSLGGIGLKAVNWGFKLRAHSGKHDMTDWGYWHENFSNTESVLLGLKKVGIAVPSVAKYPCVATATFVHEYLTDVGTLLKDGHGKEAKQKARRFAKFIDDESEKERAGAHPDS